MITSTNHKMTGQQRGEVVASRCHGSKISGSQQTVALQIWQGEKKNEQNCSLRNKTAAHTFLLSLDNANGHLCQESQLAQLFGGRLALNPGLNLTRDSLDCSQSSIYSCKMAARNTKRSISMILRKNRGLLTVQGFFFFCSKAFSQTVSDVHRASNHQLVDKKN